MRSPALPTPAGVSRIHATRQAALTLVVPPRPRDRGPSAIAAHERQRARVRDSLLLCNRQDGPANRRWV